MIFGHARKHDWPPPVILSRICWKTILGSLVGNRLTKYSCMKPMTEPIHGIKFPELNQVWKYTRLGSLVGNSMIGPHQ